MRRRSPSFRVQIESEVNLNRPSESEAAAEMNPQTAAQMSTRSLEAEADQMASTSSTDCWTSCLGRRGLTPKIKAKAEQLLQAAESDDDHRMRSIIAEQGVKASLRDVAQRGGLDFILGQEALTELLHFGKQTGNLDLIRIVLNDPQQGQGCSDILVSCSMTSRGNHSNEIVTILSSNGRLKNPGAWGEVTAPPLSHGMVPQMKDLETQSYSTTGVGYPVKLPTEDPEVQKKHLHKELQMYMNAIFAILVGASVIAGITFSGFLQAPGDNEPFIQVFCIYNSMAFYTAVATVITGAGAALPSWHSPIPIEDEVHRVRLWVRATSVLFAFSITSVLGGIPQAKFGDPPRLTRNLPLTIVRCLGLFSCAVAMTAYILRLNCPIVLKFVGFKLKDELPPSDQPESVRAGLKIRWEGFSRCRTVRVGVLGALVYALFLTLLYFLPFYAKLPGEWSPRSAAPSPAPERSILGANLPPGH